MSYIHDNSYVHYQKRIFVFQLWTSLIVRTNSGTQAIQLSDGEKKLITVLEGKFPKALEIQVADISGELIKEVFFILV